MRHPDTTISRGAGRPARLSLLVLVVIATLALAPRASAAIAHVQTGTVAYQGTPTSTTATLPGATKSGDLLVAVVQNLNSGCTSNTYSAPAGWVEAESICRPSSAAPTELWYYANVPSGITSVVFDNTSTGANTAIQLSEWSGAATSTPLDQKGSYATSTASDPMGVGTTGNVQTSGELAITLFDANQGLSSFTPGSGWTSLMSLPGTGLESDYRIGPPTGYAASESVGVYPSSPYGALIATFKPGGCSGGSLNLTAPSSLTFPAVTLNGTSASTTASLAVTADDETGSGSGWSLEGTSTTLSNGGHTLPTTATTITSGSATAGSGNCSLPTNSVGYPVALPAGSTPPTAVKLFNAAVGTGAGPSNLALGAKIALPGNAYAGSYTSTWILSLASGP